MEAREAEEKRNTTAKAAQPPVADPNAWSRE